MLVGELARPSARRRLADERLELFLAEHTWREVHVEVPRRAAAIGRKRRLDEAEVEDLVRLCLGAIDANVTIVDAAVYVAAEAEARARSIRDPDDWPLVATALVLDAAIWTHDKDLLGTGLPTWTTATLHAWLDRHP